MSRDEEEIGALIAEVYEVISGPAGERDWERFRSLFAHGARLMPARRQRPRRSRCGGSGSIYLRHRATDVVSQVRP